MKLFNTKNPSSILGIEIGKKEKILIAVKIVIAVSLILYLITKIGSVNLIKVFIGADYWILSLVFFMTFVNVYIQYAKWKLLSKICLGEEHKGKILLSLFYGFAAGAFTPAKFGEYIGRGIAFKDKPLLEVAIVAVIDKLFNQFLILFIGAISVILYLHFQLHVTVLITASLFILLFTLFYLIGYVLLNENTWQNFIIKFLARYKFFKSLGEKIILFKNLDRKTLLKISIYSFLFYACFIVQYALLVSAFAKLNFAYELWAGALTFFVKTLIPFISFAELGVREAASIYFLSGFGISGEVGFNAAFLLYFVNVLLPAFIGMFLLFKKSR